MKNQSNSRIENLKKYLLEEPKDSFLRYALAMEFVNYGENENALQSFQDLLIDDPDYLATYYQYGKILEAVGKSETADEVYSKGIKIAEKQNNLRTLKELKIAKDMLADEENELK